MSLDGLRAWIGVVERKLAMRTRVFLVLVALAVGGAGAAVYLALDAQDNAVSRDDLQAVRDELAGTTAPTEAADVTKLEGELATLRSEVATLRGEKAGGAATTPEGPNGANGGTSGGAAVPNDQQQEREEAFERFKEQGSK